MFTFASVNNLWIMFNGETLEKYRKDIFNVAYRMLGNKQDAEDVVQDTYIKVLKKDGEQIKDMKAYLMRSARNNSLNFIAKFNDAKKQLADINIMEAIEDHYQRSKMAMVDFENELKEILKELLTKLSPKEVAVYILKEVFGYSYEQLEETLAQSQDNCRKLLSRAKQKMDNATQRFTLDIEKHKALFNYFMSGYDKGKVLPLLNSLGV